MPVYKYKSFEETEIALWNFHPDGEYFKRVAELWNFADTLSPIKYPGGIFKFRSIEEANAHREKVELEHAGRVRAERRKPQNEED